MEVEFAATFVRDLKAIKVQSILFNKILIQALIN